jgi:hypothetical protein
MRNVVLRVGLVAIVGVSMSACSGESAEESVEPAVEQGLSTFPKLTTARCESPSAEFTLSNYKSYSTGSTYEISDVRLRGVPVPGKFSSRNSPLGSMLEVRFWNGIPLAEGRIVTESRMDAAYKDAKAPGFHERVRCVADLPNPTSFVERFLRAWEYRVTGVYPARHDPSVLVDRGIATLATVPAPLKIYLTDFYYRREPLHVIEFEGQTVYMRSYLVFLSSPPTGTAYDFFDATGKKIADGTHARQVFPRSTMMTNEEWAALPRAIFKW